MIRRIVLAILFICWVYSVYYSEKEEHQLYLEEYVVIRSLRYHISKKNQKRTSIPSPITTSEIQTIYKLKPSPTSMPMSKLSPTSMPMSKLSPTSMPMPKSSPTSMPMPKPSPTSMPMPMPKTVIVNISQPIVSPVKSFVNNTPNHSSTLNSEIHATKKESVNLIRKPHKPYVLSFQIFYRFLSHL